MKSLFFLQDQIYAIDESGKIFRWERQDKEENNKHYYRYGWEEAFKQQEWQEVEEEDLPF